MERYLRFENGIVFDTEKKNTKIINITDKNITFIFNHKVYNAKIVNKANDPISLIKIGDVVLNEQTKEVLKVNKILDNEFQGDKNCLFKNEITKIIFITTNSYCVIILRNGKWSLL